MKMNRRTILKIVTAMLLTVFVTVCVHTPFGTTAAGGSVTVSLVHDKILDGSEFTLKIYKVGKWIHTSEGKAVLQLDKSLADAAKVDQIITYESEEDAEALLNSSKLVGEYIKANSSDFTALDTQTVKANGETAVFSGLEDNGLYIITGDTAVVKKKRWTPVSVYIDLLNNDRTMELNTIKMNSEPIVDDYSVHKSWNAEDKYKEKEKKARPESVQVEIRYGNRLVDIVTLNEKNNWCYDWKSDESEDDVVVYSNVTHENPDAGVISQNLNDENGWKLEFEKGDDPQWHVVEVPDENNIRYKVGDIVFTSTVTDGQVTGSFNVINEYDVTELEITKNLDGYVDAGSSSNITVAFSITGYIGDTVAYTNTAGITFEKGDPMSKTVTIENVPKKLTKIEVKEVYAAGYTAADGQTLQTLEQPDADGIWRFEFDNEHGPGQGSGVVNKYKDGEYTEEAEPATQEP